MVVYLSNMTRTLNKLRGILEDGSGAGLSVSGGNYDGSGRDGKSNYRGHHHRNNHRDENGGGGEDRRHDGESRRGKVGNSSGGGGGKQNHHHKSQPSRGGEE